MNQKTMKIDSYTCGTPHVGDLVILIERSNIQTGETYYSVKPLSLMPEGVPGNMDSSVCRFHGWRGTTNNWETTAHGVRQIEMVQELDIYKTDGHDDYKIRVGKDLHPDWD